MRMRLMLAVGVMGVLAACQNAPESGPNVPVAASNAVATNSAPNETQTPVIGMANPASVYCAQLGGKSEPQQSPQGAYAICVLPSGERIEEWQLYRRDHQN